MNPRFGSTNPSTRSCARRSAVASLGDHYDAKAALDRQESAVDAAWEYTRLNLKAELPRILSPVQLGLLPRMAGSLYRANGPVHIRIFVSGA